MPSWIDAGGVIAAVGSSFANEVLDADGTGGNDIGDCRKSLAVLLDDVGENLSGYREPRLYSCKEGNRNSSHVLLPAVQRLFQIVNEKNPTGMISGDMDAVLFQNDGVRWLTERRVNENFTNSWTTP
jgi:hypothetical protein